MGISTYIWSAAVSLTKDHIGQLFLLTHNFELFRQWDIQLESLHKLPTGDRCLAGVARGTQEDAVELPSRLTPDGQGAPETQER